MVTNCCRAAADGPPWAEISFILTENEILRTSKFLGGNEIVRIFGQWDESIYPNRGPGTWEPGTALTYLSAKKQHKIYAMRTHIGGFEKFSPIVMDNDQEFLYHNFYSARCKREFDVPDSEYLTHKNLISSTVHNSAILLYYLKHHWPNSLCEFIKSGMF